VVDRGIGVGSVGGVGGGRLGHGHKGLIGSAPGHNEASTIHRRVDHRR
jgi:hypothetical protein